MEEPRGLRIQLPASGGTGGSADAPWPSHRRRAETARRRRRHGRGLRGNLIPQHLPGSRSRSERFEGWVAESSQRLEQLWGTAISDIQFVVYDIPEGLEELAARLEAAPLASNIPAQLGRPAVIAVYRCPTETAARDQFPVPDLIHDVVIEQVSELMGIPPEAVDPGYGLTRP